MSEPMTPDVVRIVGATPYPDTGKGARLPVFAVDIADPAGATNATTAPVAVQAIPAGALWPDAHDRIAIDPAQKGYPQRNAAIRNPWEVRVHPKAAGEETMLTCGGIIGGCGDGSVALLNGRALRRGDALGEFRVAQVLANEVVLEWNGSCVVIPRGRHVTVSTAIR